MTAVLLWRPSILWSFTISSDETTFFLVAKRSLLGELPFTTTFDNKSPFVHIFQLGAAAIIDSWTLLRLTAALLMDLSAFYLVSAMKTKRRLLPAYLVRVVPIFLSKSDKWHCVDVQSECGPCICFCLVPISQGAELWVAVAYRNWNNHWNSSLDKA
jgi:hypothetical protein